MRSNNPISLLDSYRRTVIVCILTILPVICCNRFKVADVRRFHFAFFRRTDLLGHDLALTRFVIYDITFVISLITYFFPLVIQRIIIIYARLYIQFLRIADIDAVPAVTNILQQVTVGRRKPERTCQNRLKFRPLEVLLFLRLYFHFIDDRRIRNPNRIGRRRLFRQLRLISFRVDAIPLIRKRVRNDRLRIRDPSIYVHLYRRIVSDPLRHFCIAAKIKWRITIEKVFRDRVDHLKTIAQFDLTRIAIDLFSRSIKLRTEFGGNVGRVCFLTHHFFRPILIINSPLIIKIGSAVILTTDF